METATAMKHLEGLNPEQQEAVLFGEGPLLVLAGAGSGKTRVVTYRIAHLIDNGVPSSQILGVTFTNKAAAEMKERVNRLTHHHVLISTFHSLGVRILRESIDALGYSRNFTIYDEEDSDKLLRLCLKELELESKQFEPKVFRNLISKAKNDLCLPDHKQAGTNLDPELENIFPDVYKLYQQKLKEYQAVDFDDLLMLTVQLFKEHPHILEHYQNRWKYLLVDEYQDTNAAQYNLVNLLVAKSHNLFVVGDPDQSIYSWRGAHVQNILNFEKDYPNAKVIRLEQNYRTTSTILDAANNVIRNNQQRYEKNLWSALGEGEKIKLLSVRTEKDEAHAIGQMITQLHKKGIPYNDMVIFYRTNFQSRPFEDILLSKRIPYVIVGGVSFYQRKEIKDILAFLRIIHSGTDPIAFARTINIPKRGLGEATLEKIRSGASDNRLSIFQFCKALVEGVVLEVPLKLSAKQQDGLKDYVHIISELKELEQGSSLSKLIEETIVKSRYISDVLNHDPETFDDRRANLNELISKAMEWEESAENQSLSAFLEELTLKSSLDEADTSNEKVNLMTIHNGKGLEFTAVFLAGMEEGLFPHINAKDNMAAIEEERRLCYVGMTRAKQFLYLSTVRERFLWGTSRSMFPSRFIHEIPKQDIEPLRLGLEQLQRPPLAPKMIREDDFNDDVDQTLSEKEFHSGDAIFHKEFGVGVIQKVYQGSAGLMIEVLFSKDHSTRTLAAKFAPIKKV